MQQKLGITSHTEDQDIGECRKHDFVEEIFVEKMHVILRVNDDVMSQYQDYNDHLKRKRVKPDFIKEAFATFKAEIALGLRVTRDVSCMQIFIAVLL